MPQIVISRLGFGYLGRRGVDVQPLCRLSAVGLPSAPCRRLPAVGEITFAVGFVVTAVLYIIMHAGELRQRAPQMARMKAQTRQA